MTLDALLARISADPRCRVQPPSGHPQLPAGRPLPADLKRFHEVAGGARIFADSEWNAIVSAPDELVPANHVLLGEDHPEDRSAAWHRVVRFDGRQLVSIDLADDPLRNGRCYDSWDETYGLMGQMPIVASSFSELLTRRFEAGGSALYWHEATFRSLGDAYD